MEKRLIGCVQVNKEFVEHYNSYECAAWWEKRKAVCGIYPVYLERRYTYPHHYKLLVKVNAEVIDDYFPGLFGGVSISNERYVAKNIGDSREIFIDKSFVEAICETGNSPGSDFDWFIVREAWDLALEEAEKEMGNEYERLSENWKERGKGDDEYGSRLSGIRFGAREISKRAEEIANIKQAMKYSKDPMFMKLQEKNTIWAREFLGLNKEIGK